MYKRFGGRSPMRALSEHREGVDLKKMFPLFVNKEDEALLYRQDITFDTYALTHDWYIEALEEAGPAGLNNHQKIKYATCFYVQDWITKILDIVDCGRIKMNCDTNNMSSRLNCRGVSIDEDTFRFVDPALTGYFQIYIDEPSGDFAHEFAGFLREGQAIIYDGASWASDPRVQEMLTNFFSRGGFGTRFIMEMHQLITGNCPTFQPVGIFLMLIHGVGNFLTRVDQLEPWDINELIESTALKMKKLIEGPDYALLPFRLVPGAQRLPALPFDLRDHPLPPRPLPLPPPVSDSDYVYMNQEQDSDSDSDSPGPPIWRPPRPDQIDLPAMLTNDSDSDSPGPPIWRPPRPVSTDLPPPSEDYPEYEYDSEGNFIGGWASPLPIKYTRRKTSPKRKRKTSPKRKRKTSPKRKRKTSPRKKK